ncbi:MAG: hypothetical protein OXH66_15540 [Gemmatimonadetes bacterium]|nr:hypothetical protein [Gemmatimonadota bacterium]
MFDLEKAVGRWRKKLESESSLSPREVDELEDHLRAGFDLEMELTPALTPVAAFANASGGMGEPADLSKEFAKAGSPRWRRLVYAGWALFAVSFVLPAYVDGSPPGPGGLFSGGTMAGWDAFFHAIFWGDLVGKLSALTNLLMLGSLLILRTSRRQRGRWLRWLVGGAGLLNLAYWPIWVVTEGDPVSDLLPGYWVWGASFLCVAAGIWMLVKERTSIDLAPEPS